MVQTAQKPIEIPQSRFLPTRFGEQCLYAQFRGQVTSIPIGLVVSVSLLGDRTGLSVVHCVRHMLRILAVASSDGDTKSHGLRALSSLS